MPLYLLSVNRDWGFRSAPNEIQLFVRSDSVISPKSRRWVPILEDLAKHGNPKAAEMQKVLSRMNSEPMSILHVEEVKVVDVKIAE